MDRTYVTTAPRRLGSRRRYGRRRLAGKRWDNADRAAAKTAVGRIPLA